MHEICGHVAAGRELQLLALLLVMDPTALDVDEELEEEDEVVVELEELVVMAPPPPPAPAAELAFVVPAELALVVAAELALVVPAELAFVVEAEGLLVEGFWVEGVAVDWPEGEGPWVGVVGIDGVGMAVTAGFCGGIGCSGHSSRHSFSVG